MKPDSFHLAGPDASLEEVMDAVAQMHVHLAAGDGDEDFRQGRASSDAAPSGGVR